MEIRARYVLVGLFVLAVIAAAAGFVYWIRGAGGLSDRTTYAIRFTGPANGLSAGSHVLFNGITVGEVTALSLDPRKPSDVIVTVAVDGAAPVRSDTRAGITFSGLTGAGSIALFGGADGAPPIPAGNPPIIVADNAAIDDLTSAARNTLGRIDRIIADNADSLRSAVSSIDLFSQALARNADKVDTIIAGLERLTGGGTPPANYALRDLALPAPSAAMALPDGQLVIRQVSALVALSTQRVLIAGPNGVLPVFDDVRWADSLPLMVQARIVQAFENAGYARVVADDGSAIGDVHLGLDLRAFHIAPGSSATAEVGIAAKLADGGGGVIDAKNFVARAALQRTDDPTMATAALNEAFIQVATDLVGWAFRTMTAHETAAGRSSDSLSSAPPVQPRQPATSAGR
jgi:phospholipid/cholesterol/gamma-HCH transport system substrate-binding protein